MIDVFSLEMRRGEELELSN